MSKLPWKCLISQDISGFIWLKEVIMSKLPWKCLISQDISCFIWLKEVLNVQTAMKVSDFPGHLMFYFDSSLKHHLLGWSLFCNFWNLHFSPSNCVPLCKKTYLWFKPDLLYCRKKFMDGIIGQIVDFSHFLLISRLMSYP